jgi:hypothetical protein
MWEKILAEGYEVPGMAPASFEQWTPYRDIAAGDKDALYDDLLSQAEEYGGLRGVSGQDIWDFFGAPRENEARQEYKRRIGQGYERALRGAGSRLARTSRQMGLPRTGAVSRMEGTIGRPEGLAASAGRARALQAQENLLTSDPNRFAMVTNFADAITGGRAPGQRRAETASDFVENIPIIGKFAAAGIRGSARDEMASAMEEAAKFNPGMLRRMGQKTYATPEGASGLTYDPFGSREQALSGYYGRPERGSRDEGSYLYGLT